MFPAGNGTGSWEGTQRVDLDGDTLCIAVPALGTVQTWIRNAHIPDQWGESFALSRDHHQALLGCESDAGVPLVGTWMKCVQ